MLKFYNLSSTAQQAFNNKETDYEGFLNLLKDAWKPNFSLDKKEANEKICSKFKAILGISDKATPKDIRRTIEDDQKAIFRIIEDTVDDMLTTGWGDNEFFTEFVEIVNLSLGDKNEFRSEDKTVLTVSRVSGNHHNLDRQKLGYGKPFRVDTYWIALKVYEEFERVITGRADWTRLVGKITEAVNEYINEAMFGSVMGAAAKLLPAGEQFMYTGKLEAASKAKFLTMVEDVQAANRGTEVVIMGTKTALGKLSAVTDVNWISEQDKLDRRNIGRVGIWEGIRLVEIPQVFKKNTTDHAVDSNKLLIMPVADNKFIKFVYEGDSQIKEVTDKDVNMDYTYEYEYMTKIGVAVVLGRYFGQWTLTA